MSLSDRPTFCANCTRVVSDINSVPLTSPLPFHQSQGPEQDSSTAQGQGRKHILEGCTTFEALSLVCAEKSLLGDDGVENGSNAMLPICSRCQMCVRDMLQSFVTLTQFSNKHSHPIFRSLKSRSQPLINHIHHRRKITEELSVALASIEQEQDPGQEQVSSPQKVILTPEELKQRAAALNKRRKRDGFGPRRKRKGKVFNLKRLV